MRGSWQELRFNTFAKGLEHEYINFEYENIGMEDLYATLQHLGHSFKCITNDAIHDTFNKGFV